MNRYVRFTCWIAMVAGTLSLVVNAIEERNPLSIPLEDPVTWSMPTISTIPKEGTDFHGPFAAQPVTVTVAGLPPHTWIRVRFNLLTVGSWDGSSPVWGPDLWSLQVRGGQQLIFTTFSTMGAYVNNNTQSYPDDYPWASHPAWTGSVKKDALGFRKGTSPSTAADLNDGLYPVEVLFPHSGGSVTLDMIGMYNDPAWEQQFWGVSDFALTALSEPPAVADDELPRLWDDLANQDPLQANTAMWRMVAAGERAVAFIASRATELHNTISAQPGKSPPIVGPEALRLRRAHRAVRIIGGKDAGRICFQLDHLFPEYFQ